MAGRTKRRKVADIRSSLEQQLRDKGADVECYQDLIDDYMFYTSKEREMQRDIKHRGLEVDAISAQGKPYRRENPSIKGAAMYNKQRLQILKELGLTTSSCRICSADDGDDL